MGGTSGKSEEGNHTMVKYTWDNVKSSIISRYFLLGILLIVGIFFCSNGKGILSVQIQEKPLIIQEIFKYPTERYEQNIFDYSAPSMFSFGMSGFMYLIMPLAGIGYLLRFCDERYGGYDRMILARIGKRKYFTGTLLASAVLSILTVIIGGVLILAVLYTALPSGAGIEGVPGIDTCISQIGFACVLAVLGGWLGFLVAVVTDSRFLSMVMPVLLYEIWTEICQGATTAFWFRLSIKNLFHPFENGLSLAVYLSWVGILLVLFGGGFYLTAVKKMEKGR